MIEEDNDEKVIKGVKMCAERMSQQHSDSLVKLNNMSKTETETETEGRLRAAFLKKNIWSQNKRIRIAFLESASYIERTSTEVLKGNVDLNGVSLKIDPMQDEIDKLFSENKKYKIEDAIKKVVMERLQPIVNLKFEFVTNPAVSEIRISFDPNGGAWSYVGSDVLNYKNKKEATMNLGWFDVPTTLHEFCHAIGMVHEHSNPFGSVILWNEPRVYKWAKRTQGWDKETTKSNIIERYKKNEINGSEFDPRSIMLYFFPGTLVDDPLTKKCCGKGTNQNLMFSPFDVLFLNNIYPSSKDMLPEEFTVKFFNDVFNEKVDIEILRQQLEFNSKNNKKTSISNTNKTSSKKQNDLKNTSEEFSDVDLMPYDLGMCDCDCKCSNNDYKEEEVCSEENENENEYEGSIFTSVYFWIGIFILFIIVAIIYSKSGETEQQLIYAEPTAPNLKTLK
jgi:hypothetical protein